MPIGPGKYDDVCSMVRKQVGLGEADTVPPGGGVILIVLGGNLGNGFSVQADFATTVTLPALLRRTADQIEGSLRGGSA